MLGAHASRGPKLNRHIHHHSSTQTQPPSLLLPLGLILALLVNFSVFLFRSNGPARFITNLGLSSMDVVYFDQLLGTFSTHTLVLTFFQSFFVHISQK